jgi:DNA modification methylase
MNFVDRVVFEDARRLTEVLSPTDPCVDVIITSPPYWNLKDYGAPNQIGHGQSKSEYLSDMERLLGDCLLVGKPTCSLWLVVGTYRQAGELQLLPLELAELGRKVGWKLRDLVIWDKQRSAPWNSRRQLRDTCEFVLFMTKSNSYKYYLERIKTWDEVSKWWVDFPERFSPRGKTPTNIWSIPIRTRGRWRKPSELDHYCSFPTALVARIIELTTDPGDLVMDPFAGSGVVLAQAAAMDRHYIGFEVNEEYIHVFEDAVRKEVAAEWEELKGWRERQEHVRLDFGRTILSLRALKYTRQITRPFAKTLGTEVGSHLQAVLCIVSIPNDYQDTRPLKVKVLVIVDDQRPEFDAVLQITRARAMQPPLSQYGIQADIDVTTYSLLKHQVELTGQLLYFYPGYKPRKYTGSGLLQDWFEGTRLREFSDGLRVPMLANIAVDVEWVLKEQDNAPTRG